MLESICGVLTLYKIFMHNAFHKKNNACNAFPVDILNEYEYVTSDKYSWTLKHPFSWTVLSFLCCFVYQFVFLKSILKMYTVKNIKYVYRRQNGLLWNIFTAFLFHLKCTYSSFFCLCTCLCCIISIKCSLL